MNDYKELVFALRSKESRDNRELLDAAAKEIEQQKAELERLEAENRAKEQYIAETIGKVIKERDAAIADLKTVALNCHEDYTFSACFACEHNSTCNGQPPSGCEFEWRGVQEVEHDR